MTWIVRYISHRLALAYHRAGWTLKPLIDANGRLSHHAGYRLLAIKRSKARGRR